MAWGSNNGDGVKYLVICESSINATEYQRILTEALPILYTVSFIYLNNIYLILAGFTHF